MRSTSRPLDNAVSRFTQCTMLSDPSLIPSLQTAANTLHAELTALHPNLIVRKDQVLHLLDAVTVQTVNLLVRTSTSQVIVDHTGEDVLVALQQAGRAHALSIRDLTRALMYTTPSGEQLHLTFEEHVLNGDDAVDVLLRLGATPNWHDLLTASVHRAEQVFTLMLGGLNQTAAQQIVLQDAANLAQATQIVFDPRLNRAVTLPPSARHSA